MRAAQIRGAPRRWLWVIVTGLVALDQLVKWIVVCRFVPAQSLPVIPHVLHLTYVQNTGAAFGLFRGYPGVFACLSVAVSVWIALELFRRRVQDRLTEAALVLIMSGAVGNLIDRARLGYVVDFIDLRVWPVFNIADSAITVGVTLLIWQAFRRTNE